MQEVKKICEDGFYLGKKDINIDGLAFISLKLALKSYFATYQTMKYSLHMFEQNEEEKKRSLPPYGSAYCELCSETIIHFHHFFELIFKEILRSENILLSIDIKSDNHEILYDLITNNTIADEDLEKIHELEFSTTLNRLMRLIKRRNFGGGKFDFMMDSEDTLKQLNILRNRLLHRGVYILSYTALDKLVGYYILPLVNQIAQLPQYKAFNNRWKYENLSCGYDPVKEIINNVKENYDMSKVAFLKELGRGAYNIKTGFLFEQLEKYKYEKTAKLFEKENNISHITKCPVCGLNTLMVYDDVVTDDYDESTYSFAKAWRHTWKVECVNCNFNISNDLKNPKEYGLNIADYWEVQDL